VDDPCFRTRSVNVAKGIKEVRYMLNIILWYTGWMSWNLADVVIACQSFPMRNKSYSWLQVDCWIIFNSFVVVSFGILHGLT
jgi:hypothetical protein